MGISPFPPLKVGILRHFQYYPNSDSVPDKKGRNYMSLTGICSIQDFPQVASKPQKTPDTKGFTHIADILLNRLNNAENINSSLPRHKLPLATT